MLVLTHLGLMEGERSGLGLHHYQSSVTFDYWFPAPHNFRLFLPSFLSPSTLSSPLRSSSLRRCPRLSCVFRSFVQVTRRCITQFDACFSQVRAEEPRFRGHPPTHPPAVVARQRRSVLANCPPARLTSTIVIVIPSSSNTQPSINSFKFTPPCSTVGAILGSGLTTVRLIALSHRQ